MATTNYTADVAVPVRLSPRKNGTISSEIAEGATIALDSAYSETVDGFKWGRFETKSQIPDFHGQNYRYVAISDEAGKHVYLSAAASAQAKANPVK